MFTLKDCSDSDTGAENGSDVDMEESKCDHENLTGAIEKESQQETVIDEASLNNDEDFKIEWIDTISIPLVCVDPRRNPNYECRFSAPARRWKGIDWNILFYGRNVDASLGLFIGYDNGHQVPEGCRIPVRYQFQLLSEDDLVLMEGPLTTFVFTRGNLNERVDSGHWKPFDHSHMIMYCKNYLIDMKNNGISIDSVQSVPMRVKFMMEELFKPAVVPLNYDSKLETGMVGLENLGATCYLNALLQMLYHINSFRCAVYKLPHIDETITTSTTLALQNVFRNLQTGTKEVTTKELTIAFGWTSAEAFLQQDVQEMMRILVDKLEDKMKNTVMDGFIKSLFSGNIRSYIRCINVNYESKRIEEYYDIQLDVKGCSNIYQSFDKYITIETLDGENQYAADKYGKQDAEKGVIFESFPPVLTIHLKRFDFDLNTMNFTKIHDYYEFPLRLELDKYLAKDCDDTTNIVPNVYVLHSVLVHQGDVGGGHYYAYIRPTTDKFQYDSLMSSSTSTAAMDAGSSTEAASAAVKPGMNESFLASADGIRNSKASKDQQWFKFNDEVVHLVTQREAVNYCYGRSMKENEYYRGLSSAYMLVYIREADAASIMKEVTLQDIPEDLDVRLDQEMTTKLALEKRIQRCHYYTNILYMTEDHVASFNDYSRMQDFMCEKDFETITCMKESSHLLVLIYLSKILKCLPMDLRLWEVEKNQHFALRVGDEIAGKYLTHRIKEPKLYVEHIQYNCTEEERVVYANTYNAILEEESEVLERLRHDLQRQKELYYAEVEDPVLGCGLGSSNLPLSDLREFNQQLADEYQQHFHDLRDRMFKLVTPYYREFLRDDMLIFLKIYDPYKMLPDREAVVTANPDALSGDDEEGDEEDTEDMEDDTGAMQSEGDQNMNTTQKNKHRRNSKADDVTTEYMPIKYVGSVVLNISTEISKLAEIICGQLMAAGSPSIVEDWKDRFQRFQYYISDGPQRLERIASKGVQAHMRLQDLFNHEDYQCNSMVIYVDMLPSQPMQICVPYELTTSSSWLKFRAFKKILTIKPFEARDAEILFRQYQKQQALLKLGLIDNNNTTNTTTTGTGTMNIQSVQENLNYTPTSPNITTTAALTPNKYKKQRSNSFTSPLRDRSNSVSSELVLSTPQHTTSLSIHRKSVQGKPFTLDVSLYIHLTHIFKRISEEINVNVGNIALYFTVVGAHAISEEKRFNTLPITYTTYRSSSTIQDVLKELKLANKMNTKYCVYYRILPYSICDDEGLDRRANMRFLDFLIVDERIKYWRRLYLEHVKSLPLVADMTSLNNNCTNKEVTADLAAAETTSSPAAVLPVGMKRSRTNSEGSNSVNTRTKPSEVRIVWPEYTLLSEYDGLEVNTASICAENTCTFAELCEKLRDTLGIPVNIAQLEALKPSAADPTAASIDELFAEAPDLRNAACTGKYGVCSDHLHITEKDIATSSGDAVAEEDKKAKELLPAFPLLVYNIRKLIDVECLSSDRQVRDSIDCISEGKTPSESLFFLAVQHVSKEDILYLNRSHPSIPSIPIVVINFTLNGKFAEPCDLLSFPSGAPFISYIRADDDYSAVVRRFSMITGDKEEVNPMRFAVLVHGVPHYVTRPRISDTISTSIMETVTENLSGMIGPGLPPATESPVSSSNVVWQLLVENNPLVMSKHYKKFPILGIQRSVADVTSKNRSGRSFGGGGSIKII